MFMKFYPKFLKKQVEMWFTKSLWQTSLPTFNASTWPSGVLHCGPNGLELPEPELLLSSADPGLSTGQRVRFVFFQRNSKLWNPVCSWTEWLVEGFIKFNLYYISTCWVLLESAVSGSANPFEKGDNHARDSPCQESNARNTLLGVSAP